MKAQFPDSISYAALIHALILRTDNPRFRPSPEFKETLRDLLVDHWGVCPPDTDEAAGFYKILQRDFE
jgi:hypothetical protein